MSEILLQKLLRLIAQGREEEFYWWPEWRALRPDVLKLDRYECQQCKKKGRYRRASIVHHVKHLKERPDLALSIWDPETGERQLVSVCKSCHEIEHPESLRQWKPAAPPITEERWD